MEKAFGQFGTSAIDGFIDSLAAAETNWKEFAKNTLRDLAKMVLRAAILNALMASFGGNAGSPVGVIQSIVQAMSGISPVPSAKGNVFQSGSVVPFAKGGVVSAPSLFPMTGGRTGLMGEAGAEAIMPLSRNSQGQLGVAGPQITINNNAGADVSIVRSDEEMIEIAVNRATKRVEAEFSRSMSNGSGVYSRSLEQGYSARRRAT
jgi:lambda family phage tail tape measure protein